MAIKRDKEGNIEWSPEQEEDIEIATEARVRAAKRIKAAEVKAQADKDCAAGKHATLDDKGVCSNCGTKPVTQPNDDNKRKQRTGLRL